MSIENNVDVIQKDKFKTIQERRKELDVFYKEYRAVLKDLEERSVIRGDVTAPEIPQKPTISYPA